MMRRCILVVVAGLLTVVPVVAHAQAFGVGSPADSAALARYRAQVDSVNKNAWKPAAVMPAKDPALAGVLGFLITGAGQIYAGKPSKGALELIVAGGAIAVGASERTGPKCGVENRSDATGYLVPTYVCTPGNDTPLYVGVGVAALSWLYGFLSAPTDAREYNDRYAVRTSAARPIFDRTPDGRALIGVSLAFGR